MDEHQKRVKEFFDTCKETEPERFKQVCDKYPTISGRQWARIRAKEFTVGDSEDVMRIVEGGYNTEREDE